VTCFEVNQRSYDVIKFDDRFVCCNVRLIFDYS
jgi:hypothetical protein